MANLVCEFLLFFTIKKGEFMSIFGNIVKKYCIDKKITQKEIAEKIGKLPTAVSNLLNRDNISLDKMLLIADALDCDLEIKLKPRKNLDKTD